MIFNNFTHMKDILLVHCFEVELAWRFYVVVVDRSPVVTGVTSLDIDHTQLLGNTVEQIAWHKAGIFKVVVYLC